MLVTQRILRTSPSPRSTLCIQSLFSMVSTRRQGGKAETLGFETVVEKVEHIETASTRPKKRRRHIKAPDDPIDFIKREGQKVDQAKDRQATVTAKLSKKAKKLLETMHTDDSLPLVRQKAARIYKELKQLYKDPPCPLDYNNPFQLLCSVILSAQATDKKVNEIVPPLYKIAPDASSMATLEVGVIEEHIRRIGLAPTKAKNILKMSKTLVERHNGQVPDTFEELEQLAGVGHKTASVVMAVAFKKPTFPVDTHIYRLGLRWGLTSGKTVEQAEADLKMCWPEGDWNGLHLRLIYFGREHCVAQRHDPAQCKICRWAAVEPYNRIGQSPVRAGRPPKATKSES